VARRRTGPGEQKAKNIEVNPRCILTTGGNALRLKVVVEGRATRVTDQALLERLAAMWESKLDWAFDVVDGAFRERSSEIAGQEFDARGGARVRRHPRKGPGIGQGRALQPDPLSLLVV
jgi:hypothetical protein